MHCNVKKSYVCKVDEDLNLREATVFNFVDADAWNNTIHFEMDGSHVDNIPSGIFQRFPRLSTFDIATGLKSIERDNFKDAAQLEYLILNDNELLVIPANVFTEATKLERFEVPNNRISTIEDFAFNDSPNLKHIQLSNNSLTTIKRNTFAGAPKIKTLRLENNLIASIEDGAFALPNLKFLMLSFNRLQTLSANIFAATPILEKIALRSNSLQTIGQAFNSLNKLKELDLSKNQVNDISLAALAKLRRLKKLLLSDSGFKFTSTDEPIAAGSSIATLDISKNNLTETDVLIRLQPLAKLRNLNLRKNLISELTGIDNIGVKFTRLEDFSITGNRFTCEKRKEIFEILRNQELDMITYDSEETPANEEC